ncbi:DUF6230 family protein [Mangrovihabitans endophyticus]|uniref:Cholesterol esterase n=1 Tax=Mangrovihabitans endophyticus TaxID=1751298 RepID=A0A8J3C824_9ACTN|nr:DUF6230 family protein [Mangrovihabitans endophyticus]GGL16977.1 hypothetical protein GCM10012284_59460 [Mangrovihabitans endophyticus]
MSAQTPTPDTSPATEQPGRAATDDDGAYGHINWRRFAIAVSVPTVIAGALVFGLANGAFAASFTVSGKQFKISADKLDGQGFAQYAGAVEDKSGNHIPVAMSGIKNATLYNLCQSVKMPGLPVSLTINAGRDSDRPATATDLLIGMDELSGDAVFTDINIGQDASTLTRGGTQAHGDAGAFGQQAQHVTITGLRQTAVSTSAGTFTLRGLSLKINVDAQNGKPKECF